MAANKLRKALDKSEWSITVIDQDNKHIYQPGLLLLPFGVYTEDELIKERENLFAKGIEVVLGEIDRVDAEANKVLLANGREFAYDYLIIATGTTPRPDQTPGMDGDEWEKSIFEFFTLHGSVALSKKLASWEGGKLVVQCENSVIKSEVRFHERAMLAKIRLLRGCQEVRSISFVNA